MLAVGHDEVQPHRRDLRAGGRGERWWWVVRAWGVHDCPEGKAKKGGEGQKESKGARGRERGSPSVTRTGASDLGIAYVPGPFGPTEDWVATRWG